MILEFSRECIIVAGVPILGTIEVEAEAEFDRYDGLYDLHLVCTGFDPETPQGLTWEAVDTPCAAWLAGNRGRVEKRALNEQKAYDP